METNDKNSFVLTKQEYQFMNALEENLKCPRSRQQNLANKYQELYKAVGNLMVDGLKDVIQMNLIKNNKVTKDDIHLATRLYFPDVG